MLTTLRRASTTPTPGPKAQAGGTARRRRRDGSGGAPARANGWTTGSAHGAGLARVLILLALVAGPAALVMVVHQGARPVSQAPATTASQTTPGQVTAVGNFAAEFVTAWLTTPAGGESSLSFYLQSTNGLRLPAEAARIQNVAVADVEHVQDYDDATPPTVAAPTNSPAAAAAPTTASTDGPSSTWQVTVAADVEEANADGVPVMVRRYYAVPVLLRNAASAVANPTSTAVASAGQTEEEAAGAQPAERQMRVLLLPQPVAGPAAAEGAELAYTQQVGPNASLSTSISQFLAAYAAGNGDVTRYVSPGQNLPAITPAPYTSVQIQSVLAREDDPTGDTPSDGQHVQVLVTALLTDREQQQISSQRVLDLTARGGRWEVSALASAPALTLSTSGDLATGTQAAAEADEQASAPTASTTSTPTAQ